MYHVQKKGVGKINEHEWKNALTTTTTTTTTAIATIKAKGLIEAMIVGYLN